MEYSFFKPKVFYESFMYQGQNCNKVCLVIPEVEWKYEELFSKIGFIGTNLSWQSERVVRFYNKRGTAEQWIKESNITLKWTRLSCHAFRGNKVRLQLFALACNWENFLRWLALPRKIKHWTLTTLREKLVQMSAIFQDINEACLKDAKLDSCGLPRYTFES